MSVILAKTDRPSWLTRGLVQVLLNGEKLPIKNFMEYVEMYLPDKTVPRVHEKVNDRWEVVVTAAPGQFQPVAPLNLEGIHYTFIEGGQNK